MKVILVFCPRDWDLYDAVPLWEFCVNENGRKSVQTPAVSCESCQPI
jgi:hypothetical protein